MEHGRIFKGVLMAVPQIVQVAQGNTGASTNYTVSATFANPITPGNMILGFVAGGIIGSSQFAIASTTATFNYPPTFDLKTAGVMYAFAGINESQTINAAFFGTSTLMSIFVMEISGVDRVNPFDSYLTYTAINSNNTTRSLLAALNSPMATRVNQLWVAALLLGGSGTPTYKMDYLAPIAAPVDYSVIPGGSGRVIGVAVKPLDIGYISNTPLPINSSGIGINFAWGTNRPSIQIFLPINGAPPTDGMIQTSGL